MHRSNNIEIRENNRVNSMGRQQFQEYMDELHMQDSKKPIKRDRLAQLPRTKFQSSKPVADSEK